MAANTPIILSAPSGNINVNGYNCVNSAGATLTTTGLAAVAVKKIIVNGTGTADKVVFDMLPGTFGSVLLSGAAGTGFQFDLGVGSDSFALRGTTGVDNIKMGKSVAGDVFFDLNNDAKADVRVLAGETYSATLLAGADVFSAQGGAITAATLIKVDGVSTTTTFAAPADAAAVASQINTAVGQTVATVNATTHFLTLQSVSGLPSSTIRVMASSGLVLLGLTAGAAITNTDADDGQSGETDDVSYTVENLIGGTGNDTLTGSAVVNVISGGPGNDTINGVSNPLALCATGDTLNGDAGNDTFIMGSTANCSAVLNGGAGTDMADFSLRTVPLTITLDGTTNDGDPASYSGAGEVANVKTDVEIVLGGTGNDTITAGSLSAELHGGDGDDTFKTSASLDGADVYDGGDGADTMDYANRTSAVSISIGTVADDGESGEHDDVKAGMETLLGGSGDDQLIGSTGDESLYGNAGDDVLLGGPGDGDICISDPGEVTKGCEI
jgi:Ca2+-binding RTX toxin-like protein